MSRSGEAIAGKKSDRLFRTGSTAECFTLSSMRPRWGVRRCILPGSKCIRAVGNRYRGIYSRISHWGSNRKGTVKKSLQTSRGNYLKR